MTGTPALYPLHWPPLVPRSKRPGDSYSNVPTLAAAMENVRTSLRLFGKDSGQEVKDVMISSNVSLGVSAPADPGIAVWFRWEDEWRCIASDRFNTVAGNVQAIHKILEARRTETRYGTLHMVRAAFRGFIALPGVKSWRDILQVGVNATWDDVETSYRKLAAKAHPDQGGSQAAMAELNTARDVAKSELRP